MKARLQAVPLSSFNLLFAGCGHGYIRILPYTAEHAFHLFDLPHQHGDSFDRQIIAQALSERIPVVTSDAKFSLYKGLRIIW